MKQTTFPLASKALAAIDKFTTERELNSLPRPNLGDLLPLVQWDLDGYFPAARKKMSLKPLSEGGPPIHAMLEEDNGNLQYRFYTR